MPGLKSWVSGEQEEGLIEVPGLGGVWRTRPHAVKGEGGTNGEVEGCGCCLGDAGWSCANGITILICNTSIKSMIVVLTH